MELKEVVTIWEAFAMSGLAFIMGIILVVFLKKNYK